VKIKTFSDTYIHTALLRILFGELFWCISVYVGLIDADKSVPNPYRRSSPRTTPAHTPSLPSNVALGPKYVVRTTRLFRIAMDTR
jgi:hypothetical protein